MSTTDPVRGVRAVDPDLAHREEKVVRRLEQVSVDGRAEGHEFVARVSVLVDDLHLLHDRGLARLA